MRKLHNRYTRRRDERRIQSAAAANLVEGRAGTSLEVVPFPSAQATYHTLFATAGHSMQSYLVVAQQQGIVEELHRQVGEDFQVIPLRSVSQLDDASDQRVAAVVIRVPSDLAAAPPTSPRHNLSLNTARTLEDRVDELERRVIEDCLARNGHRRKETAEELGISRVTLYNKMKKFGLFGD